MDYIQRLRPFSNKQVNRAAANLVSGPTDSDDFRAAVALVTDWRTLHEGPLVRFRPILEARAGSIPGSLVVTRLKRIPTIIAKVRRSRKGAQLSTMQDIGGLRAVVRTTEEAYQLASQMSAVPPQFELRLPTRDYVAHPAPGGYRGIHLVYTYRSQSDDDRNLDGLRIELQIRTKMQHVWATAVEIVGTFRRESLKSGEGDPEWLHFFDLAGDLVAHSEDALSPPLPTELVTLRDKLKVYDRLRTYSEAIQVMLDPLVAGAQYFVLTLDIAQGSIGATAFASTDFEWAVRNYQELEQKNLGSKDLDTVLVAVESPADLRDAYPNYFADTHDFLGLVYGEEVYDGRLLEDHIDV